MAEDLFTKGLEIRRTVLGAVHVDKAMAAVDDFNRDFQGMVTEYCWGFCWGREGLSHKQRSLLNLCLLAAFNRQTEFETHVRAALRNGCTVEEIRETLIHTSIYAGIPAGYEAFRVARKVLVEEGLLS